MSTETFGQLLKSLRIGRKLSLRDAAAQLKISHPYLIQLEQDIETPSEELAKRLAKFFKLDEDKLLFLARVSPSLDEFIQKYPAETAATIQQSRRDLFISHRNVDKPWVTELVKGLEQINVRGRSISVWLDTAEIKPGQSITGEINRGLETSRFIALVLTPEYFKSESGWTDAEWQAALFADPSGRQARVLPLLAKDCPYIPALIRHLGMIDFRVRNNFEEALTQLVSAIAGEAKPTVARGQVVSSTGTIAQGSVVAARSPSSGKPDLVDEILPCNLLPVISFPEYVWSAPLCDDLAGDKPLIKERVQKLLLERDEPVFSPVFTLSHNHVISFHDLEAEEGVFSTAVRVEKAKRAPIGAYLATEDSRRLVVGLLNMHIGRHAYSAGLVTGSDDKKRRYFFGSEDGKDVPFRWRKSAKPRTVARYYRNLDGEIQFCRHLASELQLSLFGKRFFLRISPTWMFTKDGSPHNVLRGPRVSKLAIRWTGKERNLQIFYHTRFWAYVLAKGRSVINMRAGDQSLLIDTVPALAKLHVGIRSDRSNLDKLVEQVNDDFDWNEEDVMQDLGDPQYDE